MNLTSIHEHACLIPDPAQWVTGSGIAVRCDVGCRCDLRTWHCCDCGVTAAVALIQLLGWEIPYAAGAFFAKKKQKAKSSIAIQMQVGPTVNAGAVRHL